MEFVIWDTGFESLVIYSTAPCQLEGRGTLELRAVKSWRVLVWELDAIPPDVTTFGDSVRTGISLSLLGLK